MSIGFGGSTGFSGGGGGGGGTANANVGEEAFGYAFIAESTASTQNFVADVRTKLDFQSTPVVSVTSGSADNLTWWDATNGVFQPTNPEDTYKIRVACRLNPDTNNRNFFLELDIGGSQGVIWSKSGRLARGAGNDTVVNELASVFVGSTFIANGGTFYLTIDGNAVASDFALFIQRTYKAL